MKLQLAHPVPVTQAFLEAVVVAALLSVVPVPMLLVPSCIRCRRRGYHLVSCTSVCALHPELGAFARTTGCPACAAVASCTSIFRCPRCGAVSHNPHDAEHGYCDRCQAFTGADA